MYGTYSTDSNRIFIAIVNFLTNKITYTRYLQQIVSGEVFPGVIISDSQFYLGGYDTTIYKATSTSFTAGSYPHGIIYSPTLTCQQVYQYTYPEETLSVNGLTITQTANTYTSSSIAVTDLSSSLPSHSPIIFTQFEGQYVSDCSLNSPVAPNDYTAVSSTQQTTTFIYATETASLTIPITPFTASKLLPLAADPVFTYQLDTYYQPPNGVTVDPATGDIQIISVSLLGAAPQQVVIEGKLSDCQTINAKFTLIGQPNTAPSFQGIGGNVLPELVAVQGDIAIHQLPRIFDPNVAQIITTTLIDGGGNAYPQFIDFTDTSHNVFFISPSVSTPVGSYPMSVQLQDGFTTTTYSLNIVILEVVQTKVNIGSPIFTSILETVTLKIGNVLKYTLPSYTDPDEKDEITISVQLKEAIIFSQYDAAAKQITFKPQNGTYFSAEYKIGIILADNNVFSKKTKYNLAVQIEPDQYINETDDQVDENFIKNGKRIIKSGIKIVKVRRSGNIQLKITSSQIYFATAIARTLQESHIKVFVAEKSEIRAKINDVQEDNILSIKLEFKDRDKISAGMVSHINLKFLGIGFSSSQNLEGCHLRN
ncbi:hypothetical protein FGO68_gene11003 [Halteria grandinella]|uniref:Uncharacterized protein n=1 Tax=Halteria grandinella TaxID=5974 RepID=A0A8J8P6T9_HALGN|nr:hypothetical protein FGO68_gene11003 [Halteria grandinella]